MYSVDTVPQIEQIPVCRLFAVPDLNLGPLVWSLEQENWYYEGKPSKTR